MILTGDGGDELGEKSRKKIISAIFSSVFCPISDLQ